MKPKNKNTKWLDRVIWAMLAVYIIGIAYLLIRNMQANLLLFVNTITLLFILGLLAFIAYMLAMRE
ncbi:hypothetical protein KY349_05225 [Candidatus Woesearchaeota archaeon]|nr:hypothetical protein [Candidatus Woesearchaeota archaeon]